MPELPVWRLSTFESSSVWFKQVTTGAYHGQSAHWI